MAERETKKKAKKSVGQTAMWIIMALLILGLGGFGVTNFSGTLDSVGSVGDREIDIDTYARSLQQELRGIEAQTGQSLSFEEAQQMGLVDATLSRMITNAAFEAEADRLGISVGDDTLAAQVRQIQAFQGPDGQFDREAYRFSLERAGMSEARFEDQLRHETARTILQGAVVAGQVMPPAYADTLVRYISEERDVTWALLDESSLDEPVPAPTEDEVKAFYEANIDRYMIPERKQITYAWLDPEMLIDQIEVDAAQLDKAYEARRAEFERPARRLVERLIYPDTDTAQQAADRLSGGEADFDTLVEDRGLELADIDMGDVTERDLGAAGAAVFAAQSGEVVGPLDTDLGPALFRINGVFPEENTDPEDAREIVRQDLVADQARRQVETRTEAIEDMLAGGATLEDLAQETDMQLGEIAWFAGLKEGIAAYDGFDDAAATLEDGAYPELLRLTDGGIFAMRLEGVQPAEPAPLDEVRDRVAASWETEQTLTRLREKAASIKDRLAEAATFESLGLEPQTETGMTRNGSVLGTTEAFTEAAFGLSEGEVAVTEGFNTVQVLRLDAVRVPDMENGQASQLVNGLQAQAAQSVAQDLYRAFSTDIRNRAGVRIDQNALNAVHANFR